VLCAELRLSRGSFTLDASVSVSPGTVTAVFGPSGAGKTTLLDAVAGLARPQRGFVAIGEKVLFDGRRGVDVPPERRELGYVFQDDRLFPHLSVRKNLRYGMGRVPAGERRPLERQIVELLALGPLLERRPAGLSGGERQRVTIGRALLARPRALLLDEPLSSLDGAHKEEILGYLCRLREQLELPMVYVTHQVDEIQCLADRVVILRAGHVEAEGSVEEILGPRPLGGEGDARRPAALGWLRDADGSAKGGTP
jgi:molybdate transport system ATP-binding protein